MTTLWKRAAGAIKDRNSIVVAKLSRKNSFRNADLEAAIIKATSHDERLFDKKNTQRVFAWLRASPKSLRCLGWALSKRMEKTRSWVVAIKGLMLMHGVISCKNPAVQTMGRLPFDLSSFSDGYCGANKVWGFNAFVRAYFAFLDQRAVISFEKDNDKLDIDNQEEHPLMIQQLWKLQKWQSLLDMLLQIRPLADNMKVGLILEAMDCVIIEIFDVYSRICSEIAKVLLNIFSVGKVEAAIALKILQRATIQGEELSLYFELCQEYGILNANEFPTVTQVPEEDLQELERIIKGIPEKTFKDEDFREKNQMAIVSKEDKNAIFELKASKGALRTIITDKWVVFDETVKINGETNGKKSAAVADHPAADDLPLIAIDMPVYNQYEIPDLITF